MRSAGHLFGQRIEVFRVHIGRSVGEPRGYLPIYCPSRKRRNAKELGSRWTDQQRGTVAAVAYGTIEEVAKQNLGYADGTELIAMSNLKLLELTRCHLAALRGAIGEEK